MDNFLKASGGILIALVFYLILAKQSKDISLLLTVVVCTMVIFAALKYLEPIVNLIEDLRILGNLDNKMLEILMKSVGIALIAEIVGHICSDTGNSAMGKSVQILATGVILWFSVPLFSELLKLMEEILVAL